MNCKPGDLAIVVMCPPGTEHLRGKIIRLTTLARPSEQTNGYSMDTTACWNYEGPRLKTKKHKTIMVVNDCCLRPIRGDELNQECERRQLELMTPNAS